MFKNKRDFEQSIYKKRSVTVLKCMPCIGIVMSCQCSQLSQSIKRERGGLFNADCKRKCLYLFKLLMLKFKLLWM